MDDDPRRAAQARRYSPFLNTKQAAFYLNLSPRTLTKMRSQKRGPKCRMHASTWRYHIDDLNAWSNARTPGRV